LSWWSISTAQPSTAISCHSDELGNSYLTREEEEEQGEEHRDFEGMVRFEQVDYASLEVE